LSAGRYQYIGRESGEALDEQLFGDRIIGFLYSQAREHAPSLLKLATSRHATELLGLANFDSPLAASLLGNQQFLKRCGVDLAECVDSPASFKTPRQVFERRIRYWETRPMEDEPGAVVSPADARVVPGSFSHSSGLYAKGKFFDYAELLGESKTAWLEAFRGGDFAVFRLTPDKYHYNHAPVAGRVVDFYELNGRYHSCNPGAVVEIATPYSKNKRTVTIIDTDVDGGTCVGLVAMVEVTALMIGDIVQCYSEERYDSPRAVETGMFVNKGRPKSLYRPGSSTDILIFQAGRVTFADDLLWNLRHATARSRFSVGFGQPLVETDIQVRSFVGRAAVRRSG
jgi:phosphatidylserine decarboxylase